MIDYQIVSTESTKDMDVTLSWDTIFGVLNAARKYMVEDAARAGVWCMAEVTCSQLPQQSIWGFPARRGTPSHHFERWDFP